MRQETVNIYKYDELSDSAKEKAKDWWRQCESQDFDPEFVFEDVERVANILGISFDVWQVPLINSETRAKPKIWYSGFCSQGDGASFEGSYSYKKGAAEEIRKYAPQDTVLHSIADDLLMVQKGAFYEFYAYVSQSGRYYHSYTMQFDVRRENQHDIEPTSEQVEAISEALRRFADWIYHQLESEYEYRMSDENVEESIICNEYEFYEDGSLA